MLQLLLENIADVGVPLWLSIMLTNQSVKSMSGLSCRAVASVLRSASAIPDGG
jgi:hypothetical protein